MSLGEAPICRSAVTILTKVDSGPVSNSAMPSFVSRAVAAMMPRRPT
jgi:hypothetical protein